MSIHDINGKIIKKLFELPSGETSPSGFDNVQNVPRSFDWRDDEPATVTWCEPLDSEVVRRLNRRLKEVKTTSERSTADAATH